ncbi:hypothetical protein J6590_047510 [Homalodisca vitripennis]|nr:hypothetical protein J6590_047510 [Homalodisca vitripennis]
MTSVCKGPPSEIQPEKFTFENVKCQPVQSCIAEGGSSRGCIIQSMLFNSRLLDWEVSIPSLPEHLDNSSSTRAKNNLAYLNGAADADRHVETVEGSRVDDGPSLSSYLYL